MLGENRRFFLLIIGLYILIIECAILFTDKGSESIYFCTHRHDILTFIFKKITYLGEWISLTVIGIYLLIINWRVLVSMFMSFIPMDMLMLYLKKLLNYPRPLLYFQHGEINAIADYPKLYHHSMPSGHTFTAFFCASFLIFFFDLSRKIQIIVFSGALAVGLSRMYLLCHFKEDVLFGSVLGIIGGLMPTLIYKKLFAFR